MEENTNPTIPKKFSEIKHKKVSVNGIKIHIAEMGESYKGTVLFLHGYPELWYSWRHQLLSLSTAGYRAVAPDLRGYGDSDAPPSAADYTALHVVGDLVALLDYLVVGKVFLVGHDWGALIAWNLCLLRPDRVKALVNLSVPFTGRNPDKRPVQKYREAFGDDFYICRFQEPGVMEKEYDEIDTEKLIKFCFALKDTRVPIIRPGALKEAVEKPIPLPPWLSEEDVKYYADTFKKTGFTGGLNYYRNLDL